MRTDDWLSGGASFRYRGHDVFYRREGRGDTVVLIHGFPTASWDWHRVWEPLVRRYDVVAADMLGFGFSSKPPRYAYGIEDQASLHEALLEHLGIERAHLVAHDYGDTVAQELLARQAETPDERARPEIRSVCLLNGGILPGAHRPLVIQKLLSGRAGGLLVRLLSIGTLRRSFRHIFGSQTQPTEQEIREFWRLITHNGGRRMIHRLSRYMGERIVQRERWVGILQSTSVPLRLINGLADPIAGAHVVERYRSIVPRPDVVGLEGIGHYPQIEAPGRVVRAVVEFIERQP